jgi:TatD DNase family protein
MFVDTHCHIHEAQYPDASGALERAHKAGVGTLICVGTDNTTSREAAEFAANHEDVYFSVGVHPHDAKDGYEEVDKLARKFATTQVNSGFAPEISRVQRPGNLRAADAIDSEQQQTSSKLVAIGEIGLDYFYTHSPREIQIAALEAQLQLALDHDLPVIFHVREAFDDFWPIFHNFPGVKGELHSFTDSEKNLQKALEEGLYIGVNGISTFSKTNQEVWDRIPLEKMLLETDAPFLTPVPVRGKVNEPAFVRHVAEYHAKRRGVGLEELARATSANAKTLFSF